MYSNVEMILINQCEKELVPQKYVICIIQDCKSGA